MTDLTTDLWELLVTAGRALQAEVDKKIVARMEFNPEQDEK